MIIFLDIEHPKALEDAAYRAERAETMARRARIFQGLSGEPCVVRHFSEFRKDEALRAGVKALVTSGNRSLWEDYDLESDFAEFKQLLLETRKPVLGICGGHQLIGLLLGGQAEPLRRLVEGEDDSHPQIAPGFFKEWGFYPVEFAPGERLFAGFEQPVAVKQMHFWHLTRLPDSFQVIAYNRNCPVQAMRLKERPVYGVQFHPEFYDAGHPDGQRILENFFALPGAGGRARKLHVEPTVA